MQRKTTKPRKFPKQNRSAKLTESIIEATTRILSTEGYEGLNTNKVAQLAGVSIGSLYQYYPNKESLVIAVAQYLMSEDQKYFEELLTTKNPVDLESKIILMINYFLVHHQSQGKLRNEIYFLVFKLGSKKEVFALRKYLTQVFKDIISLLQPQENQKILEAKAFTLFHACLGILQGVSSETGIINLSLIETQMIKIVHDIALS
jgi:AcrR family transcriptional regulator